MSEPGREGPNPPHEAPAGLAATVLRGAGLGGLGFGASQALTLGIYIVLARLITPEEFGDFAAATVLIGFALLVTETGMSSAIVQRRSRVEEAANTALIATILTGIGFTAILLAVSPLVGDFFDSDEIQELAAATSGIIFLRTIQTVRMGSFGASSHSFAGSSSSPRRRLPLASRRSSAPPPISAPGRWSRGSTRATGSR